MGIGGLSIIVEVGGDETDAGGGMSTLVADPLREVLSHLEGVKPAGDGKHCAKCPSHEDQRPSLSISLGDDGRVLLYCHAGCTLESILGAIGMKKSDLFPPRNDHRGNGAARKIVATYDYCDAEGVLIYQVCRYQPKDFRQRRPDGAGGWLWNMDGVQRVLYRLPELMNASEDRPDDWVFIAEGEKDCNALAGVGLVATCNPGGAKKWQDEYSESLRGRRVCIVADRDENGREHAHQVAASLHGIAAEVKIIEVQP